MNQNRTMIIIDEFAIIRKAEKCLPKELKEKFISAIAELEDNNNYINNQFPVTRLHKISGIDKDIYRADIDKISGWRFHLQMSNEHKNALLLKNIIEGQKHDSCMKIVKTYKNRYNTKLEKK